jgi:hypothetical protein
MLYIFSNSFLFPTVGNNPFVKREIMIPGQYRFTLRDDFNGDGIMDLALFHHIEKVYQVTILPGGDSLVSGGTSYTLTLDSKQVLVDSGEVNGTGGSELVLLYPDGVYYIAFDNFVPKKPFKLFSSQSIFTQPSVDGVKSWDLVRDISNIPGDEILIPAFHGFDLYHRLGDKWEFSSSIKVPVINSVSTTSSSFEMGENVTSSYTTHNFILSDYNGDTLLDFIVKKGAELLVFYQDSNGRFSLQNTQSVALPLTFDADNTSFNLNFTSRESREFTILLNILDINHDSQLDLIFEKVIVKRGILSINSSILIYLGKNDPGGRGPIFNQLPDFTIPTRDVQVGAFFEELNSDGNDDMIIPVIDVSLISLANILLSKKATFTFHVYVSGKDQSFITPELTRKVTIDFSFSDDQVQPLYKLADFNGDGYKDLLTYHKSRLQVYYGRDGDPMLSDQPSITFDFELPTSGFQADTREIDNDNKSDILLSFPGTGKDYNRSKVILLFSKQ